MQKKNIILGALLLAVCLISILGYYALKEEESQFVAYNAFPQNTAAVLTVNNYNRTFSNLLLNNLMWQELMSDEKIKEFAGKLTLLDSLIKNDEWSAGISEDLKWFISFQASGPGFDNIIVLPLKNLPKDNCRDWFIRHAASVSTYALFEDVEIFQCDFQENMFEKHYFCFDKGLLIISARPDLVEDAIRTLHNGKSIQNNSDFRTVEKTSGSFADWNFFVNYRDISALKLLGLNTSRLAESEVLWSDWTALDATVHPDLFLLNGFSHVSPDSYLSLFEKQKAQDIDAIEIIPDDVSLFFHFGISNYEEYARSKRSYFEQIGKLKAYTEKVEKLKQEYQFDVEGEFDQWVSNEFGIMFLPETDLEASDSRVAFFRLSDVKRTKTVLGNLSDEVGENDESGHIRIDGFLDDFESVLFRGMGSPYYLIIDKYLLFSGNRENLDHVRELYLRTSTLKKSEMYARFSGNLSDQSNVYIYINLPRGKDVYSGILNETSKSFFEKNPVFQQKFEQMGIQFKVGKKGLFYQHMALSFNAREKSVGNILWETQLDTHVLMKPQIVYNHYNNAREIMVQDVSNTIYLIDNKGNIVWKRQMKEAIHGKVNQIDVFKNNKLQMLFSGESSIYLIDRKGKDVENFPIQLPSVATNELKVIDYEKNREYRILIGVRGGDVLNYDRFGKPISGWKFKAGSEITYPLEYFLLNGKDYIVAVSAEGQPYLINRRGEQRFKISGTLPPYHGQPYSLEISNDENQCRFVTTDESGNFVKLKFNGEKEMVNLDLISREHQFLYDDLNGDRKNDFVLLDSNKLMAFDHNREKIFELQLDGSDPSDLNLYRFQDGMGKIGFTDVSSGQIYLYRSAGGLDDHFPLKGNTPFTIIDLNKDGRQNVIVGMDSKVIVYNLE